MSNLWELGDNSMKITLPLHKHCEKVCSLTTKPYSPFSFVHLAQSEGGYC